MSSSNLNCLIISFYFPPYQRVGGRRWAKHFKYFNKENINSCVLTVEFLNSVSSWDKDIADYKERITRVKLRENQIPYFKKVLPQGFTDKLKWKLSLYTWTVKKHFLKGNYNDVSINMVNDFYNAAQKIIKDKSINTIIVSVGPFRYSEILIQLKKNFPKIKYVIDFRDYWEDGFSSLSSKQVAFENELQNAVVKTVDLILTPNMEMKNHYQKTYHKNTYCLPHCFDEEEIHINNNISKNSFIKFLYGGAFYNDIGENIDLIKKVINEVSAHNKISADFYVSIKGYEQELNHPFIKRFDFIDTSEYFSKVQEADYVILILPPNRVNAMSSKFFELVALRKPILYFGGVGDVSEYLIKYRLGYHITSENLTTSVDEILSNITTQNIPDKNYDVSIHTFKEQTKLLTDTLNQL